MSGEFESWATEQNFDTQKNISGEYVNPFTADAEWHFGEGQKVSQTKIEALEKELASVKGERDAWIDDAARFNRNEDFYRGLVEQIGAHFGQDAYTSDDGSIQQDVLCLKVPELVSALMSRFAALQSDNERLESSLVAANLVSEERLRNYEEERADSERYKDWIRKVCAIVQPAKNAEEGGMDIADIIAQRFAALQGDKEKYRLALESLTPGGSEFVNDPDFCVAHVRKRQAAQHQMILSFAKKVVALQSDAQQAKEFAKVAYDELTAAINIQGWRRPVLRTECHALDLLVKYGLVEKYPSTEVDRYRWKTAASQPAPAEEVEG